MVNAVPLTGDVFCLTQPPPETGLVQTSYETASGHGGPGDAQLAVALGAQGEDRGIGALEVRRAADEEQCAVGGNRDAHLAGRRGRRRGGAGATANPPANATPSRR